MRPDGRKNSEVRSVKIQRNFVESAEGSAMISMGNTKVICTASIEDKVPASTMGRVSGRTHEIQRLIGRALRSVVDLSGLGERTIWIDCDVLQADGGTRTASITGAFICLSDALKYALRNGLIEKTPLKDYLAAISVGVVHGEPVIDLCYSEDASAEVDMNVVMTSSGRFVEIQGTAEGTPFSKSSLDSLLKLAEGGITDLINIQKRLIEEEALRY
jgi:ribonuclease PH